jgi:hypothetical protein
MTQALYAHMNNKRKMKKKILLLSIQWDILNPTFLEPTDKR